MIHGLIAIGSGLNPQTIVSVSSDCHDSKDAMKTSTRTDNNLLHHYNEQLKCSFLTGHDRSRCFFASHLNCDGNSCCCGMMAENFLFLSELKTLECYLEDKKTYLQTNMKFPYLMVFVQGSDALLVSCYGRNDFTTQTVSSGLFFIRDCLFFPYQHQPKELPESTFQSFKPTASNPLFTITNVSNCRKDLFAVVEKWMVGEERAKGTVERLSGLLVSCFQGWPKPKGANLSLLMSSGCQVYFESKNFNTNVKKVRGPKGKVTAFNFFSKNYHKKIRDNDDGKDGTNGRNGLIGKIWAQMSKEEKEPFENLAKKDEERFLKEISSLDPKQMVVRCGNQSKLTGYNLFVHQEKQFLAVLGSGNLLGQYCGRRWKHVDMENDEKNLYESLYQAIISGAIPSP